MHRPRRGATHNRELPTEYTSTPVDPEAPRPANAAADVRARLVWLSGSISVLLTVGQTRPLTDGEQSALARFRAESDQLLARLAKLRGAFASAQ